MSDPETMAVYASAAKDYAAQFTKTSDADIDQEADLAAFCGLMPKNGTVLDLGCGPGQWAAKIKQAGYEVCAMDASPEMAALAKADFDVDVTVATFDALDDVAKFDGVWANFSLLHAPRAEFPAHLARVHRALKPKGAFHIGMKLGDSEARDPLGRFYSYYAEDALVALLQTAGFTVMRKRLGTGTGLAGSDDTFVILTAHG